MSRPTFRSRPIDLNRQLEVFRKNDLLQRADWKPGDRAMPTMASGMEAEEETEHHLQRAIATETLSSGRRLIPTPEAKDVDYYKSFYKPLTPEMIKKWKRGLVSQEISLIDEKPPDYNLDSEDEAFRQTLVPSISEIELEKVLEKLEETEKSRGPLPPFCKEWNWGKGVIDEGTHNEAIHKYWVKKRTRLERPIKYHLLREKPIDCTGINESYVCFRRRLDKIQTRRNKQRDQSERVTNSLLLQNPFKGTLNSEPTFTSKF